MLWQLSIPHICLPAWLGMYSDSIWRKTQTWCRPFRATELSGVTRKYLLLSPLQEVLIPKMKWRKICPAPRSLLISDSIPCVPQESLDSTDGLLPSGKPAGPGELGAYLLGAGFSLRCVKRAVHSQQSKSHCFLFQILAMWHLKPKDGASQLSWLCRGCCL